MKTNLKIVKYKENLSKGMRKCVPGSLIGLGLFVLLMEIFLVQPGHKLKQAAAVEFCPDEKSGFVEKSNRLLVSLLHVDENMTVFPKSIEELNQRYPRLQFDCANSDGLIQDIHTLDVRLVGIDDSYLKTDVEGNRDLVDFYENSNFQNVLSGQRKHLGIAYFNIIFKTVSQKDAMGRDTATYVLVDKILINKSMLRLSLDKQTWTGTIMAGDNSLFSESDYYYLSWGNNVIPIPRHGNDAQTMLKADLQESLFKLDKRAITSWLPLAQKYKDNRKVTVSFGQNTQRLDRNVTFRIDDHKLNIKTENINCIVYSTKAKPVRVEYSSSARSADTFDMDFGGSNSIKLVFWNMDYSKKVAEMLLSTYNPLLTLSGLVRTNEGSSRYLVSERLVDHFTYQVTHELATELGARSFSDTAQLTLDPVLGLYLQEELVSYAQHLVETFPSLDTTRGCIELSVTVMDMATGAVLAMPYYRTGEYLLNREIRLSRKSPAMIRRYIGSTFKPLLTLGVALANPEVLDYNFNLPNNYNLESENNARFFGFSIKPWQATNTQWDATMTMRRFLGESNDVYPVALTVYALRSGCPNMFYSQNDWEDKMYYRSSTDNVFTWSQQPLMVNLDSLYNLPSNYDTEYPDSERIEHYVWRYLDSIDNSKVKTDEFALGSVRPDAAYLNIKSFDEFPYSVKSNLVPWVLGQGSNEWSCLKLAEAWCRMLTKRKVKASMLSTNAQAPMVMFNTDSSQQTWNRFLDIFLSAQSLGTLQHVNDAITQVNSNLGLERNPLLIFSKTGTPDEYQRKQYKTLSNKKKWLDIGMFNFGLMRQSEYENVKHGRVGKGVVFVLRVTYVSEKGTTAINSDLVKQFYTQDRLTNLYRLAEGYF